MNLKEIYIVESEEKIYSYEKINKHCIQKGLHCRK